MNDITLIVPYFNQPLMLARQIEEWAKYPSELRIILVDDCSDVTPTVPPGVSLLRILDDVKWNRNEARNIGAHVATSEWILQADMDHILPARCAYELMKQLLDPTNLYRFCRWRRGTADETRKKDLLPREETYGRIKPHGDSYLVTREAYWVVNGYDLDYAGHLGGGSPFLAQLEAIRRPWVLPCDIFLEVFTRSECADASTQGLSRDTSFYSNTRRWKERYNRTKSVNPIRSRWEKVQ